MFYALPIVNCCTAIKNSFKNYANFKGRIRRSEYWFFMLLVNFFTIFFLTMFLLCVTEVIGYEYYYDYYDWRHYYGYYHRDESMFIAFTSLFCIYICFITLPTLAATVRRLHDTGRRGEYIFVGLVPFFGTLTLLVFLCQDSQNQDNEFGPSTKYSNIPPQQNQPFLINSINSDDISSNSYNPNIIAVNPVQANMNNLQQSINQVNPVNNNINNNINNKNIIDINAKPGAIPVPVNTNSAPVMYPPNTVPVPTNNNMNIYQNQ